MSVASYSQAPTVTRYPTDSFKIFSYSPKGAELILENSTRQKNGAFLKNRINGRTEYAYAIDSGYISNDTFYYHRGDGWYPLKLPGTEERYLLSGAYKKAVFDTATRRLVLTKINGVDTSVLIPAGSGSGNEIKILLNDVNGNVVTISGDNGASTSFTIPRTPLDSVLKYGNSSTRNIAIGEISVNNGTATFRDSATGPVTGYLSVHGSFYQFRANNDGGYIFKLADGSNAMEIGQDKTVTLPRLAGTGKRMVIANENGTLQTGDTTLFQSVDRVRGDSTSLLMTPQTVEIGGKNANLILTGDTIKIGSQSVAFEDVPVTNDTVRFKPVVINNLGLIATSPYTSHQNYVTGINVVNSSYDRGKRTLILTQTNGRTLTATWVDSVFVENGGGTGTADGNNYTSSINFANDNLTLQRFGLSNLTATIPLSQKLNITDTTNKWQPKGNYLTNEADPVYTANGVPKSRTITINGVSYDLSANRSWTISTGSGGIALTDLSATLPLTYNSATGVFGINQANTTTSGYLSSTDWNTFNGKISQAQANLLYAAIGHTHSWTQITGKPTFATVAISGDYNDLINKPAGSAGGTVTAVTFPTAPSWLTATIANNSTTPVISLTPTPGLTTNSFLATPNGATGAVGLRAIVAADIPTLNQYYLASNPNGYITSAPVTSVFGRTGAITSASGDYTTDQVTEATNKYYTDARARAAITLTQNAGGNSYSQTTGVLNISPSANNTQTFEQVLIAGNRLSANRDINIAGKTLSFNNTDINGGALSTGKVYVNTDFETNGTATVNSLISFANINAGDEIHSDAALSAPNVYVKTSANISSLITATQLTANRSHQLPNKDGTFAMLSDIQKIKLTTNGNSGASTLSNDTLNIPNYAGSSLVSNGLRKDGDTTKWGGVLTDVNTEFIDPIGGSRSVRFGREFNTAEYGYNRGYLKNFFVYAAGGRLDLIGGGGGFNSILANPTNNTTSQVSMYGDSVTFSGNKYSMSVGGLRKQSNWGGQFNVNGFSDRSTVFRIMPRTGNILIGKNYLTEPTEYDEIDVSSSTFTVNTKGDAQYTQGSIPWPRIKQSSRDSIVSPVAGLSIYQIDNNPGVYLYNGSSWNLLGAGTGGGSTYTLPIASSTTLGGIKVGSGLAIDGTGVLSATGTGGGGITATQLHDTAQVLRSEFPNYVQIDTSYLKATADGAIAFDTVKAKGFVLRNAPGSTGGGTGGGQLYFDTLTTGAGTFADPIRPLQTMYRTVNGSSIFGTASGQNISTATLSGTETLTNKRITQRVQALTSSATVTPNADSDDAVKVTAQATAFTLANPSGTPTAMQPLIVRIKDNGTARAISYGTQYRAVGITLPTTTAALKTLYLGMIWNSDDFKWDIIGVSAEN